MQRAREKNGSHCRRWRDLKGNEPSASSVQWSKDQSQNRELWTELLSAHTEVDRRILLVDGLSRFIFTHLGRSLGWLLQSEKDEEDPLNRWEDLEKLVKKILVGRTSTTATTSTSQDRKKKQSARNHSSTNDKLEQLQHSILGLVVALCFYTREGTEDMMMEMLSFVVAVIKMEDDEHQDQKEGSNPSLAALRAEAIKAATWIVFFSNSSTLTGDFMAFLRRYFVFTDSPFWDAEHEYNEEGEEEEEGTTEEDKKPPAKVTVVALKCYNFLLSTVAEEELPTFYDHKAIWSLVQLLDENEDKKVRMMAAEALLSFIFMPFEAANNKLSDEVETGQLTKEELKDEVKQAIATLKRSADSSKERARLSQLSQQLAGEDEQGTKHEYWIIFERTNAICSCCLMDSPDKIHVSGWQAHIQLDFCKSYLGLHFPHFLTHHRYFIDLLSIYAPTKAMWESAPNVFHRPRKARIVKVNKDILREGEHRRTKRWSRARFEAGNPLQWCDLRSSRKQKVDSATDKTTFGIKRNLNSFVD